jgi:hypothetical protein
MILEKIIDVEKKLYQWSHVEYGRGSGGRGKEGRSLGETAAASGAGAVILGLGGCRGWLWKTNKVCSHCGRVDVCVIRKISGSLIFLMPWNPALQRALLHTACPKSDTISLHDLGTLGESSILSIHSCVMIL